MQNDGDALSRVAAVLDFAICILFLTAWPAAAPAESPAAWQGKTAAQWARRLADPDMRVRWYAVYALGELGPAAAEAVGPLGKVLANRPEQEYVRAGAAWALGRIGPAAKRAAPLLTETLASTLISVRRNSAEALGNLGAADKDSVSALVLRPGRSG